MLGGYFTNYPKHVICILANEFCERFSFYGMKAILVIYLWNAMGLSKSTSTAIYHAFNVVSYFTPLLGAVMADAWLGKCRTIIYVSILYCLGNIVMTITAIPFDGHLYVYGTVIALLLIALGTGGIKPCVSSFGGDQFNDSQKRQKDSFFSIFYMAINIGSLLSTIITPTIRGGVFCYNTSCYPLAFAIPAILMIVAIVVFIIGTRWYTNVPPTESVIARMAGCIAKAIFRSCSCSKKSTEKKEHWLDYAEPDYDRQFISDVKDVTRVVWIFLPLPMFWALFDQQGSRWTLQATQMNGDFGSFILEPDLIQVLNPLLIVVLVPILESLFFPCLDKLRIPFRPLQRMGWGMILAASSFVIAAGIQAVIDKDIAAPLAIGQTKVQFINTSPCSINISSTDDNTLLTPQLIDSFTNTEYTELKAGNLTLAVDWTQCRDISGQPAVQSFQLQFKQQIAYQVFLGNDLKAHQFEQTQTTPTDGLQSTIRFYNSLDVSFASITLKTTKDQENTPRSLGPTQLRSVSESDTIILVNYYVDVVFSDNSTQRMSTEVHSQNGAVYTVILRNRTTSSISSSSSSSSSASSSQDLDLEIVQLVDIPPWSTNILLQIPQYFVISLGECLFSITGLAFAYTQAPVSMKSFMSAIWLVTVAIGNVIVIIVAESGSSMKQVYEFVLFAGLMFFTTLIFIVMALFYQYVDLRVADEQPTLSTNEEEDESDRENDGTKKKKTRSKETRDPGQASSKAAEAGEMEQHAGSKSDVTHL